MFRYAHSGDMRHGAHAVRKRTVPPSTIRAVIKKHGGMTEDNDKLPPMVERDEDGYLWAAAAEPPSTTEEEEEEETDEEEATEATSVIHMGPPPPPPPPPPPMTPTTTRASWGALSPPQLFQDAGISPIER